MLQYGPTASALSKLYLTALPFTGPACGIWHAPTFGSELRGSASRSPNLLHFVYLAPLLLILRTENGHS